ncbi:MAG: hypothetical protein KAJ63_02880 [Methyloprofundus sp.]|nr:hypothetical protein [Methyloprofundus sp.]
MNKIVLKRMNTEKLVESLDKLGNSFDAAVKTIGVVCKKLEHIKLTKLKNNKPYYRMNERW